MSACFWGGGEERRHGVEKSVRIARIWRPVSESWVMHSEIPDSPSKAAGHAMPWRVSAAHEKQRGVNLLASVTTSVDNM